MKWLTMHRALKTAGQAVLAWLVSVLCAVFPADGAVLPQGFSETLVASGLSNPTAMAIAPDGRVFICQQGGQLRVIKNGVLLGTPFLTVVTDPSGERGLLGIAIDPGFATNQHVYIYYTVPSSPRRNRVSRFTANGDVSVPGSETVILELDNLSSANNHNGGAMHFGLDGKLYVAVGENATPSHAQTLSNLHGKILRINPDGSIPEDNPFYTVASGKNRAIWALGLRNPFTFAIQPGTGRMFINDVGQSTWEEINEGAAGANYGWPACEGACVPSNPSYVNPVFQYPHGSGSTSGCSIIGGAFYNPATNQFPAGFTGTYFFADYCNGWIRRLDPANSNAVSGFATGISWPVDIKVGGDGFLYYLSRGQNALYRVRATGSPSIAAHPADQTANPGETAVFTVSASGDVPLRYRWQRDGADIVGAGFPTYTLEGVSPADNGALFRCVVTNFSGSVTSNPAVLNVTSNEPPVAAIFAPVNGALYRAGETIQFTGAGSDPEDGALAPGGHTWTVVFHHADHTHPFLGPLSGVTNGSFIVPTQGETAADVFYRIHLEVSDSGGLTNSAFVDILPRTAEVVLESNPPGLILSLDGQPQSAPVLFTGVAGMLREIGAASPQTLSGTNYEFLSWSDGGNAVHTIVSPEANTQFVAQFQAVVPAPLLFVSHGGDSVNLVWSAGFPGYVLESTPTLSAVVPWMPVTNPVAVNGLLNTVTVDAAGAVQFFQLVDFYTDTPDLVVTRDDNVVLLTWPSVARAYELQVSPSLDEPDWVAVTNDVVVSNGWNIVSLEVESVDMFFRLFKAYTNVPLLSLMPTGGLVELSWPVEAVGFDLYSTRTLTPLVPWTIDPSPVVLTNGSNRVSVQGLGGSRFFRLVKP